MAFCFGYDLAMEIIGSNKLYRYAYFNKTDHKKVLNIRIKQPVGIKYRNE